MKTAEKLEQAEEFLYLRSNKLDNEMRLRDKLFLLLALLSAALPAVAARVDTTAVYSNAMKRDVAVSVIVPEGCNPERFPTVYLLPGYGDNHLRGWLGKTDVRKMVDCTRVIAVVPDPQDGWYFDSPVNPEYKYETFITAELISYIDGHYPTIADRRHRAVTGLSMGGHGALYLSIRHQDLFSAAGSMSGGVDITKFPENWKIKTLLGEEKDYPNRWAENSVMGQLPLLSDGALRLIVDCGTEDFFFEVNCALHRALAEKKIAHEFTTRPGKHNWAYWQRSLRDHLLFFRDWFDEADKTN